MANLDRLAGFFLDFIQNLRQAGRSLRSDVDDFILDLMFKKQLDRPGKVFDINVIAAAVRRSPHFKGFVAQRFFDQDRNNALFLIRRLMPAVRVSETQDQIRQTGLADHLFAVGLASGVKGDRMQRCIFADRFCGIAVDRAPR